MTNRNIGPIRDPGGLANFLDDLRRGIQPSDDVGLTLLYRSELAMLAVALDGYAAEERLKATQAVVREHLIEAGCSFEDEQAPPPARPKTTPAAVGPSPSTSPPGGPACSPGFGIARSTPDTDASTGPFAGGGEPHTGRTA